MAQMAGSWLIASVCSERMKQMSSAFLREVRQQARRSSTCRTCPAGRSLNFDGAIGKRAWPLVMVVRRWPLRMLVGQILVVPLLHHRLVVEQVHLRGTADHVQVDDALRLGRELRTRSRVRSLAAAEA